MIPMIFIAVALALFLVYYLGKVIGREDGFYEGRSETYRDLIHIIEHYKELADAKDTPTKGA
jgi:hypothetical protein